MEKEYNKLMKEVAVQLETLRDIQIICLMNMNNEIDELNGMQSIITRLSEMNKQMKTLERG